MTSENVTAVLWSIEEDGIHCKIIFKDGSEGESVLPFEALASMMSFLMHVE